MKVRKRIGWAAPLALALAAASLTGEAEAGRFYRWVDDDGNVHYSDKVPPEASGQARNVMNERGITVDVKAAALNAEQIAEERRLARQRAEQRQIAEARAARDRVLMQTFGSVDDMEMTRDGKIAAVEALIRITSSNINGLRQSLSQVAGQAAEYERSGRPVPDRLRKRMNELRERIRQNEKFIEERRAEQDDIRLQFERDIERFRELKARKTAPPKPKRPKPEQRTVAQDLQESEGAVVVCKNEIACEKAWALAQLFARKFATQRIQLVTEALIVTFDPEDRDDIAMMVARYPEKDKGARLVLEVICQDSEAGREFCATPTVQRLKSDFKTYLGSGL
jgi:hypothetical protein